MLGLGVAPVCLEDHVYWRAPLSRLVAHSSAEREKNGRAFGVERVRRPSKRILGRTRTAEHGVQHLRRDHLALERSASQRGPKISDGPLTS